jgi:hypothetical protein
VDFQITVGSQVVETVYIVNQIHHILQQLLEYKTGISYTETAIICVFMWTRLCGYLFEQDYVVVYVNKIMCLFM